MAKRFHPALLALGLAGAHASAATAIWEGGGPFATGVANRTIHALAVSPDGLTVYAGTGGGTMFRYGLPVPVVGVCGAAHGVAVASAPAASLCAGGTASAVAGAGPWTWSCVGENGGATAGCAASLYVAPTPDPGPTGSATTPVNNGGTVQPTDGGTVTLPSGPVRDALIDLPTPPAHGASAVKLETGAQTLILHSGAPGGKVVVNNAPGGGAPLPTVLAGSVSVTGTVSGAPLLSTGANGLVVYDGGAGGTVTASVGADGKTTLTPPAGGKLVAGADAQIVGTIVNLPAGAPGAPTTLSVEIAGQTLSFTVAEGSPQIRFVNIVQPDGTTVPSLQIIGGQVEIVIGDTDRPALALSNGLALGAGAADTRIVVRQLAEGQSYGVANGMLLFPAGAFRSARAAGVGTAVMAGETAEVDAAGKLKRIVLRSAGGAGDALTLALAPNLSFATTVPNLDATSTRLGRSVQAALAQAAGATLAGGQSGGVLTLDIDGARIHALPLGDVVIDTGQADGAKLGADGTATVVAGGVVARFAPSVADLGRLAQDLAAVLPGATLSVSSDGLLLAEHGGARYALRPDWISSAAMDGTAGFATAAGERLSYARNDRTYLLHPIFLNFATLTAALADALPGATATTNADGTVAVGWGAQRWRLAPEMRLETAPTGTRWWWAEADGRLWLRYADGTAQGFRVE